MSPATLCIVIFLSFTSSTWSIDCEFNVLMKQKLKDEGFHRNLTYIIKFLKDAEQLSKGGCFISIEQNVPSSLFANPDELKELYRARKLIAEVHERVDVEAGAEHSTPFTVYLVSAVKEKFALWLPLHSRYHTPIKGGGYHVVPVLPPKMFIKCRSPILSHCPMPVEDAGSGRCLPDAKCAWKHVPYKMASASPTWRVPVGNIDHSHFSAKITVMTIMMFSISLVRAILVGGPGRELMKNEGRR